MTKGKMLEWSGVITAIIYSLLVALNIGLEFLGFMLLLISAILIENPIILENFSRYPPTLDIPS